MDEQGVFIVTAEAEPFSAPVHPEDPVGAYINVYTTVASPEEALAIARREVADAGWAWGRFDAMSWVVREDFVDNDEGLAYFEQSLIDGVVVVIHTYSGEDESESELQSNQDRRH